MEFHYYFMFLDVHNSLHNQIQHQTFTAIADKQKIKTEQIVEGATSFLE